MASLEVTDAALAQMQAAPWRFELSALVKALLKHGYAPHQIQFEGTTDLVGAHGPLLRRLQLHRDPSRAVIGLNAGLLSHGSPLPGYFREFAARLPDPDRFLTFIGFWDSILLRNQTYCAMPSLWDPHAVLGKSYQRRLNLTSSSSLHWLFRSAYPELRVEVGRCMFPLNRTIARARVGDALDGRSVLGGQYREQRDGFLVSLHVQRKSCEGVRDWEAEAARRLEHLEPHLVRVRVPLAVTMRFLEYQHGLKLVGPDHDREQLGVRPWLLPQANQRVGPGEIRLRGPWPSPRARPPLPAPSKPG